MQSSLSSCHGRSFYSNSFIPNSRRNPITTTHPSTSKSLSIKFSSLLASRSPPLCRSQTSLNKPIWTSTPNLISRSINSKPLLLPPLHCGNSANSITTGDNARSFWGQIEAVGEAISTAFPLWVALGCLVGLVKPSFYNWVQPKWTIMSITLTMLGMGITLTFDDLRGALAMPKELITGFVLSLIFSILFRISMDKK